MSEVVLEVMDEDDEPEMDGADVCHHGVGFDEECEACDLEMEEEEEDANQ